MKGTLPSYSKRHSRKGGAEDLPAISWPISRLTVQCRPYDLTILWNSESLSGPGASKLISGE